MGAAADRDGERAITVSIPGRESLTLRHLVLDLNGTLSIDGYILTGIPERINLLRAYLQIHVLTAGSHGHVEECAHALGLQPLLIGMGAEKRDHVRALGAQSVVAMGNGRNDVLMFEEAALAIAVLGAEGLCATALHAADVVVADPCAGLDLLLHPNRLVATLRL